MIDTSAVTVKDKVMTIYYQDYITIAEDALVISKNCD